MRELTNSKKKYHECLFLLGNLTYTQIPTSNFRDSCHENSNSLLLSNISEPIVIWFAFALKHRCTFQRNICNWSRSVSCSCFSSRWFWSFSSRPCCFIASEHCRTSWLPPNWISAATRRQRNCLQTHWSTNTQWKSSKTCNDCKGSTVITTMTLAAGPIALREGKPSRIWTKRPSHAGKSALWTSHSRSASCNWLRMKTIQVNNFRTSSDFVAYELVSGTPILTRRMTMRRETIRALEVRKNSVMAERRKSAMQTLGANNEYGVTTANVSWSIEW